MRFVFPHLHEVAYEKLISRNIIGDYSLHPHYDSMPYMRIGKRVIKKRDFAKKLETILREKFNRPSHYSLHGTLSNIPISGELIPVNQGDIVEVELGYHPELGSSFTYNGVLYGLEFDLDNEFHLGIRTDASKLGYKMFFDPYLDIRRPTLQQIISLTMRKQHEDEKPLPIRVIDSGIMP